MSVVEIRTELVEALEVPVSHGIGGSRFREMLEEDQPSEDELHSTGVLTDPFQADRLRLAGFDESHINLVLFASKSAPPTPYHVPNDFKWHGQSTSSGSESTSPVAGFMPLMRRLSGRVSSSSDQGNRLRKKRIPSSPRVHHAPLLSPSLSAGLVPERGFNLLRQVTREEDETGTAPASPFMRPVNRRSFSLPLLMIPNKRRAHRMSKQSSSASSGHDADISQESITDEIVPDFLNDERRSFEILSRKPSPAPEAKKGLAFIDEMPVALGAENGLVVPVKESPRRSRVMSSPPRPDARAIFATPTKKGALSRRHSLSDTPALSPPIRPIPREADSGSSLNTILATPTSSERTSIRHNSAPPKCVLLPLAASTPSLNESEWSDLDTQSSISLPMKRGDSGIGKDLFGDTGRGVRVYGEDESILA